MQAKLIKQKGIGIQTIDGNDYFLTVNDKTYHTNPITQGLGEFGKLSYKNCKEIEFGYDLNELAKIEYPICEVWNDEEALIRELAFKKGFQKAIELMGDKKFTEEDVLKAIEMYYGKDKIFIEIIQSLQQTEWDVEIEMQKVKDKTKIIGAVKGVKGSGNKITTYKSVPKLDADGCLILKKI